MPPSGPIDARTERGALGDYVDALCRVIAAFAENVVLYRSGPETASSVYALGVAGREAVTLTDSQGDACLSFLLELRFRAATAANRSRRWTVHTAGYVYELRQVGHPIRPIVSYHWHPHIQGIGFPHIHLLAADPEVRRLHVATPHCTLLHPLAVAMRDFGVRSIRGDWRRVLEEANSILEASLEWAAQAPFPSSE